MTYPNQKTVIVHREKAEKDFLGIKNENWTAACRDLKAQAFILYLYFVANANNYKFALSPAAVINTIGMPESTYADQIKKLISKGYLVKSHGSTYDFYEVPPHKSELKNVETADVLHFENNTDNVNDNTSTVKNNTAHNREINNIYNINKIINSEDNSPKDKMMGFKFWQYRLKQLTDFL